MTRTLPLDRLCRLAGVDRPEGLPSAIVHGVTHDSRRVASGDLFVAIAGARFDGVAFAADAARRGAVAVVADRPRPDDVEATWITVPDARVALARLAAAMHGDPSHELLVVGVTGTNGKTTTSYLLEGVLAAAGLPTGRIGSVTYRIGEQEQAAVRTTPEATDLQALMRQMVDAGHQACVMEASSHALDLHRVDAIRFGAAVFTNLTRDHLDYHGDMSRYFAAKRRLFEMLDETAPAVVNADDDYGLMLADHVNRPVTYGFRAPADVVAERVELTNRGITLHIRAPRSTLTVRSELLGRGNAYNLLAAAATGVALALPAADIERGLAAVRRVPGRMEIVSGERDDVTVLVDFAHTDDALKGLLDTARPLTAGRLITVFGCGGDRDRTKRPLMGTVAARLSDVVVITSDNPRSEDPAAIARDVAAGAAGGDAEWRAVPDRREAIHEAVTGARPGDLVVVAGKGHEQVQVIGDRTHPFDDVQVAREALAARRGDDRTG